MIVSTCELKETDEITKQISFFIFYIWTFVDQLLLVVVVLMRFGSIIYLIYPTAIVLLPHTGGILKFQISGILFQRLMKNKEKKNSFALNCCWAQSFTTT